MLNLTWIAKKKCITNNIFSWWWKKEQIFWVDEHKPGGKFIDRKMSRKNDCVITIRICFFYLSAANIKAEEWHDRWPHNDSIGKHFAESVWPSKQPTWNWEVSVISLALISPFSLIRHTRARNRNRREVRAWENAVRVPVYYKQKPHSSLSISQDLQCRSE